MENKIELGSEFNLNVQELTIKENNLESFLMGYDVSWLNFGRSAIRSIPLQTEKKILLPEFICESVINCFLLENIIFYRIDAEFNIDAEDLFSKMNWSVGTLYICHYFGYLQDNTILEKCKKLAKEYEIRIIEDTTQSFFSEHRLVGDVALASVRKWLPIPQGAILYSRGQKTDILKNISKSTDNYRVSGMVLKDLFINGKYDTNVMYREIFSECEERIDSQEKIESISDLARFIIKCCDIDELIEKRKHNAKRLGRALSEMGVQARSLKNGECPLVYPIRVKNRDIFRKYLMDNRIYCAIHWPFDNYKPEERTMAIRNAEELISLPIDQRYGDNEIDYMIDIIKNYKEEL